MKKEESDIIRLALPGSFFAMIGLGHLFLEGEVVPICQNHQVLPNSCICLESRGESNQIDNEGLTSNR